MSISALSSNPPTLTLIKDVVGNVFQNAGSQHSNSNDYSLAESLASWDSAFSV